MKTIDYMTPAEYIKYMRELENRSQDILVRADEIYALIDNDRNGTVPKRNLQYRALVMALLEAK